MSKFSTKKIQTFSVGYGAKDASFNELDSARLVARHLNTEHHEFIVEPKILEILPHIIWHMDEPFADSSAVPTYLVSQAARQNITVALNGIGGDEAFGGYPRYLGAGIAGYYHLLPKSLRRKIAYFSRGLPESTKSRDLARWFKRFASGGQKDPEAMYLEWISYFGPDEKDKLYSPEMKDTYDPYIIHRWCMNGVKRRKLLDKIFFLDVKTYLPEDLLFMGDKMTMAHSLEMREPFCDYKLLEFSAHIPVGLKMKGFGLKSLLKESVAGLLPKEVLTKKKHGFMIPIGRWLKEELKPWVFDLLSEANIKKRGYFNSEYVRWMLKEHMDGRRNFDDKIWALLILEIWHQIFIDKKI